MASGVWNIPFLYLLLVAWACSVVKIHQVTHLLFIQFTLLYLNTIYVKKLHEIKPVDIQKQKLSNMLLVGLVGFYFIFLEYSGVSTGIGRIYFRGI